MKNTLILHGKPARERYENPELPKPHEANWLPWLGAELGKRGIAASIPAFPTPYYPVYDAWKEVFEKNTVNDQTGIVTHSAGAEFALRWLSEHDDVTLERLVLVAPWNDTKDKYGDFSEYNLDLELPRRVGRITIFNSLDDTLPIRERAVHLRNVLPGVHYVEFENHGHFKLGDNMTTVEFPELLEELVA